MKTRHRLILLLAVFTLLLVAVSAAHAQTSVYDLAWRTMDSGGGHSSGGGLTLDGTIGQPDAGQITGGGLVLRGGFWSPRQPTSAGTSIFLPVILR